MSPMSSGLYISTLARHQWWMPCMTLGSVSVFQLEWDYFHSLLVTESDDIAQVQSEYGLSAP